MSARRLGSTRRRRLSATLTSLCEVGLVGDGLPCSLRFFLRGLTFFLFAVCLLCSAQQRRSDGFSCPHCSANTVVAPVVALQARRTACCVPGPVVLVEHTPCARPDPVQEEAGTRRCRLQARDTPSHRVGDRSAFPLSSSVRGWSSTSIESGTPLLAQIERLKLSLANVANGKAFLLQGGDCAGALAVVEEGCGLER